MADEPVDIEVRKEWSRLRALLYEGRDLALCTDERDGHRWLTDRYVLLDVSDSIAVDGIPDGAYKLVQSKGFTPNDGFENYLDGGIVDYLTTVETGVEWRQVHASEWSVAEHPGKAMLVTTGVHGHYALIGESTWATIHRHYESPVVEYDVLSDRNLFRVCVPSCELRWVVAYVAGIRCPEGQEDVAKSIAVLTANSTSN